MKDSSPIKIIETGGERFLDRLAERKSDDLDEVLLSVSEIVSRVAAEGDSAVAEYTLRFDGVELDPSGFRVPAGEIESAGGSLDPELRQALETAWERIRDYHRRQLANSWFVNGPDGEILGQKIGPVDSAAIYAPGGKAAYPSSVLMGAGAAKTAGVERVILLSPPGADGAVNPAVLFAARVAGIAEIYRLGGAQAIAAAAWGTETIPPVRVIAGPGNIYVTAAKKLVYGKVNIDMLAGPSEILVIADSSANPAWVAADMLSQAEHDERAGCILVTPDRKLAREVQSETGRQLARLSRREIAEASLRDFSAILLAGSLDEAAALADRYAPEHLELMVGNPWSLLGGIRNAGAIFLGHRTPEAIGDYWAGPNHVLPTGGSAACFSPLGVHVFLKRSSIVAFNDTAFDKAYNPVLTMARAEGLEAHARSVEIRKEK